MEIAEVLFFKEAFDDAPSRLRCAKKWTEFYEQSNENALAFLKGTPPCVVNPEMLENSCAR
jgi:hypothetical protein